MSCPEGIVARFAGAAVCALLATPVAAAQWEWNPRLQLGYLVDDNYRLDLPENEIEVSGPALDAQLELLATGQLTELRLVPRLHSTYFPEQRSDDSTDYFLRLALKHSRQKLRTALRADYEQETVLRSELPRLDPEAGLGESGGADAGRIRVQNRRELLRVLPSMSYDLTQRYVLELAANYLDVGFDRNLAGAQVGYRDAGASAGLSWAWSERLRLTLKGLYSIYDPDDSSDDAHSYGLQAEWSRMASETLTFYLRIGAQRTDFEQTTATGRDSSSEEGYLAGIGGRWNIRHSSLFIDATRSVGPTASGFMVNRDQLRLRLARPFTPRLAGYLGVRAVHDAALQRDTDFASRSYVAGGLGLEWRILRQLSITLSYDYAWQEFEDEPADARSQGAFISFVYEPHRRN